MEKAKELGLLKATSKYMNIKTIDNKICFDGVFRISTKGSEEGFQIVLTQPYASEIDNYNKIHPNKVLEFTIFNLAEEELIEYYIAFKDLRNLHQKIFNGNSPNTPQLFSESIVRYLFNLNKSKTRKFDAIDNEGRYYEIKATTSEGGNVTINSNTVFDYLFWLYIDFDNDEFIIKKGEYNLFKNKLDANNSRISIALSNFMDSDKIEKTIKIDILSKRFIIQ